MAEANTSDDLSAEKNQTLGEFQEIVGKDDTEECRQILERHSWNMEAAVQSVFSEQEGIPSAYDNVQLSEVGSDVTERRVHHVSAGSNAVDVHRRHSWTEWLMNISMFPYTLAHIGFSFAYHCASEFFQFVLGIIWPGFGRVATNPIEDMMKFRTEFEKKYGAEHPVFYMGTYAQVLSDAKKELKFLIVYLHSSDHQDTPSFCQNVLCNPNFKEYTRNKNLLFWACDVNSNEGYKVSRAMRERTYPFLAIVCIRDGRMTIVWRVEGMVELDPLIAVCEQVFHDNEASIVAARAERNERLMNREIRSEQDAAFVASLEKDKQKRLENEKKQEAEKKAERLRQEKEIEKEMKLEKLILKREDCRRRMDNTEEPSPTTEGALQLRVKLPHGETLQRYFLKTDELQLLYDFVLCCEESPGQFQLCSNFPRNVYLLEGNESRSLENLGIKRSTAIFVQELFSDSSEEEDDDDGIME